MLIIDRYLLRQFIQAYLVCLVSLTGLFVVIDAFTNLDDFIKFSEGTGDLVRVMAVYYTNQSFVFFDRTSALLTLIAAMFTVTWIQRYNEMTALEAAGISKRRIVMPVIVAAAVVSLMATANREVVVPNIRENLGRSVNDALGSEAAEIQPRYDNQTDILLRGAAALAKENLIKDPSFLLPPGLDKYGKAIIAHKAVFYQANSQHPSGYLLSKVTEPAVLSQQPSLRLAGRLGERTVVFTPHDNQWLESNECFVASDVTVDMLEGSSTWRDYSSTPELIHALGNRSLDFGADVRVAIHSRIVQPFRDMTLLLLGLPLVLSRGNRNVFVAIGMCILLAGLYFMVIIGAQHLGNSYWISAPLAAWLPLLVFVPVAVWVAEPLRE